MRLIRKIEAADCTNPVIAKGLLKGLGGRVTIIVKLPVYTNEQALRAGTIVSPPVADIVRSRADRWSGSASSFGCYSWARVSFSTGLKCCGPVFVCLTHQLSAFI